MSHLHNKPGEHDHTASAYIVRHSRGEPEILLHFHKKLNRFLQFGGHIETKETPWQAVIHELREESGYLINQLKILQPQYERLVKVTNAVMHPVPIYHQTHHFNKTHFHTDVAYAFVTDQDPNQNVGAGESDNLRWFNRNELVELSANEIFESVREAALYVIDVCLPQWERVETHTFQSE